MTKFQRHFRFLLLSFCQISLDRIIALLMLREAFKKKNYGDSEIGPTPLNPPTPTSDRGKKCRDSCVEI